jgi:Flp pilus assembly protein TadD
MRHTLCGLFSILTFFMFMSAGLILAKDTEVSPARGVARYKKLVRQYPQEASYQNALGYYFLKAGNLEEAEAHFLKAIELDGSYPIAHNNLGVLYLQQGQSEQAEKEFREAIKLNPLYCKAQYNLAVAFFRQRRYAEAAKAYLKAREIDSEYVDRRDNRENTQEKIERALEQVAKDDKSTQELKRMRQWFAPHY